LLDGEALASLAHELRTPVHAIRASAELILGGDAGAIDDGALALVGDIADAAQRLDQLVGLLVSGMAGAARASEPVELMAVLRAARVRLDPSLAPARIPVDPALLAAIVAALCGAMAADGEAADVAGRAMPAAAGRGGVLLERMPAGGRLAELRTICQWADHCLLGTGMRIVCSADGVVGISWPRPGSGDAA
jgi:signal transduction histidine kinase